MRLGSVRSSVVSSMILLPLLAVLSAGRQSFAQSLSATPASFSSARQHYTAGLRAAYGRLPLSFEESTGQTKHGVRFVSRGDGYSLLLSPSEAVLALRIARAQHGESTNSLEPTSSILHLKLLGADRAARIEGLQELSGKNNYFIGSDPRKWRTNVPVYARVRYRDLYPGVDLVFYGNQSGQLEYDFVVAPGADPEAIRLSVQSGSFRKKEYGANSVLHIDPSGDLVLRVTGGDIRFQKPVIYQQGEKGEKHFINGRYLIGGQNATTANRKSEISFNIAPYDHSKPLVIDPAIAYSSLLGGATGPSVANAVALFTDPVTAHVYAYVAGSTCAPNFPLVNPEQPVYGGGLGGPPACDAFVTKFDPSAAGTASVVYSTYLGGSSPDQALGIAIDSTGNAYITGSTSSTDFPTANAFQPMLRGSSPYNVPSTNGAFLSKLNGNGSSLLYSTYFGGSGNLNEAFGVALDSNGRAYIAGITNSADLPTLNPVQASLQNSAAGTSFVAAFDTTRTGSASLSYSTFLNGSQSYAIAVDYNGAIHVGGTAGTPASFPIVNGFQSQPVGGVAAASYVKLNPVAHGAAELVYSTYLGGKGDGVQGIAVDAAGKAYLTGFTTSSAFPVTNGAFQTYTAGSPTGNNPSAFAARIDPLLAGPSSLLYSTLLYGPSSNSSGQGSGQSIAVDAIGDAFVTGVMGSGFSLVNPVMNSTDGVMQSIDGGLSWTPLSQGLSQLNVTALGIDKSTSPRTLYAGTYSGGVFASADGGLNWNHVLQLPDSSTGFVCHGRNPGQCVFALAVDPTTPSNVYAATTSGMFRSQDRGGSWSAFGAGLSTNAMDVLYACLVFDGSTLYACTADGLDTLTPGATAWTTTGPRANVTGLVIDYTTTPHTLYAASNANDFDPGEGGEIFKSTDGAKTWTDTGWGFNSLAIDVSTTPHTLYGAVDDSQDAILTFYRSTDGGSSWMTTFSSYDLGLTPITLDTTTTPPTVYLCDEGGNGIFKSSDRGNTWTIILTGLTETGVLALDTSPASPTTPATLYAGTPNPGVHDAFVAELNPTGSDLLFSTYLGGIGVTRGTGIAVDGLGNVYTAGVTSPGTLTFEFPTINGYPTSINTSQQICGPFCDPDAFFTKLGSVNLPSGSSGSVSAQVGLQTGALTVTFPNITGTTTGPAPTLIVTPLSSTQTANFSLSNNLGAYDISTTANYSGSVTLCFQALTVNDPGTFNSLTLLHIVNGAPVNITSSYDFPTRTICGTTATLSPFVLVKGALGQLQDIVRYVNESNVRHGIQSSLDSKLQNAQSAFSSAIGHDYSSVCNMMSAFISSVQAQAGQAITTAEAAHMISAALQVKATIGCAP